MIPLDEKLEKDTFYIGKSRHNAYLLMNDITYPWVIMIPQALAVTEIYQLNEEFQEALSQESQILSKYLMKYFKGDRLNVGKLGNVVSQLHIHHIVRSVGDKSWPGPVWGQHPAEPYKEYEGEKPAIVGTIGHALAELIKGFELN